MCHCGLDRQQYEVNAYDYAPYSNILNETTCVANPWQYAGGYFESSTGFVKFGTRYYNPAWGRWTQQDPVAGSLGSPDSLNRYVYVGDNPVSFVDPSGRIAAIIVLAIIGCIGGALGNLAAATYAAGPSYSPSANTLIKTLIAGCLEGALVGLLGLFLSGAAIAVTADTITSVGLLSLLSGAAFGMFYAILNNFFPG